MQQRRSLGQLVAVFAFGFIGRTWLRCRRCVLFGRDIIGDQYSGTWYQEGWVANPLGHFVAHRQSKPNQASVRASESLLDPTIPPQRTWQ